MMIPSASVVRGGGETRAELWERDRRAPELGDWGGRCLSETRAAAARACCRCGGFSSRRHFSVFMISFECLALKMSSAPP